MDIVSILSICSLLWTTTCAIKREYFIRVVEEEWDYAPKGNLLHKDNEKTKVYLDHDASVPLIGTKYIKAMYREFTDASFAKEKERPEYMGLLGPFIHSEVGDHIVVHFQNRVQNHNFSMHPHGIFYNKDSEGALYIDGTAGKNKEDDIVPPGGNHTYVWIVRPEYGPTADDPNCITWLIHSHQFAEEEIMTGAILIMATCKKGTLTEDGKRKDVDREYPLLFMIFDENLSAYIERNTETYLGNVSSNQILKNINVFQRGNMKYSINGYIFGNLHGLEACVGERISLHIAVAGNDEDTHSVYFQGHNMIVYHHRMDTVGLYPGSSLTAILEANNEGRWLVSSQNVFFQEAGMQTLFHVDSACSNGRNSRRKSRFPAKERRYYIKAEEHWWNFAPSGYDIVSGIPLNKHRLASESFGEGSNSNVCKLNGRYKKALYRAYKNINFREPVPHPNHLGILGTPIKAEVGDIVKVHFFNNASRNYSIQPYRFFVDYDESGIQYDNGPQVAVQPGTKRIYTWRVPESVGPTRDDPDCLFGRYYSSVDAVGDTYSGLTGPLVICRRGTLNHKGKNIKVDKEFYLMFSDFNERYSHYFAESIREACPAADVDGLRFNTTFVEANMMRSLNGRVYGNLDGLAMCKGERINWYVMSVGSGMDDIHSPFFHGNTFELNGARKDTITLTADIFQTLFMIPDNPGTWSLEDQVTLFEQHIVQMNFLYEVKVCSKHDRDNHRKNTKNTRTYYIAAVEREWDYAPHNVHPVTGEKLSEFRSSKRYYNNDPENNLIGHIFKKAMYREFTDETFQQEKQRTVKETHLGFLGPIIKAEVGDKIRVTFKNMASYNFSIVPHGVFYDKENEGYVYNDSILYSEKMGGIVKPNDSFTYEWLVPSRAGPGPEDFNCITWAYTSHVDYTRDIYSTLIGPLIVCRKGILNEKGQRTDLDVEFALLFFINNEGASAYLDENIRTYLHKEPSKEVLTDPEFIAANDKLSINGYIYGNIPNVTALLGERIAWYILSLGEIRSTHTVHWHGNTFIERINGEHRHDVLNVLPGDFETVEMVTTNKGTWLMHCHVNNHSDFGMEMVYTVQDPDDLINSP